MSPMPNFHACRLRDPGAMEDYKTMDMEIAGKPVQMIMATPKSGGDREPQAVRYPTDDWTKAQAKKHCAKVKGSFEGAEPKEEGEE